LRLLDGVCVRHVCVWRVNTVFDFFPNPLDSLKFISNPPDERVDVCVWRVSIFFWKVSTLYVTGNSLVRRKVWAPKRRPPRLLLTVPSRSYFSRESPFAGPSRVSSLGFLGFSIFSLSSRDLDVSAPSFCSSLVVRGREIKNARRWSCGAEKIKCCYQLRGSEKHVHSKEGSTGHLYECPCASASV